MIKFLRLSLLFSCLSLFFTTACSSPTTEFNKSELDILFKQLTINNETTHRTLTLSNNISLTAELEGTSKGNGTLKIHNLFIRAFDQHDDGSVYVNSLINIDLSDITDDGIKEILISGIIKYTGENENDPASYEALDIIYKLDCKSGYFKKLYQAGSYSIELAAPDTQPINCNGN